MKICVQGLWHLGSVTAACLAEAGFEVVGLETDRAALAALAEGRAPVFEPGLDALIGAGLASGRLSFTADAGAALAGADLLWVCFDTPVDDDDRADVAFVVESVAAVFPHLADGAVVLISSQLPVGSTRGLARRFEDCARGRRVHFAYSPENLRLGRAIEVFKTPERIVVGADHDAARRVLAPVFAAFCPEVQWLGIESAEMTKHALNAFLATCVTFINEIATVCEGVGADAAEVEAALRSEPRIGRKAYIRPGGPFAGGTLARDVTFLGEIADRLGLVLPMLGGVIPSNREQRHWHMRQLEARLDGVAGRVVTILGMAYKPGTDTLRRSSSVELARRLLAAGAEVRCVDPAVAALPEDLGAATLHADAGDALSGSDALVVMTEWPAFRDLDADQVAGAMARPLVLDQNRFLEARLGKDPRIVFVTMGKPL